MASLAAACLARAPPSRLHAAAAGVHADRRQAALTRGPKAISRRLRQFITTASSSSSSSSSSPPTSSSSKAPQPLEQTWSNPTGAVLTELIPGKLWVAERPFVWASIDVGGKTAVARLSDGSLFVHSPLALDDGLKRALAEIGPVRHIVAPNYEHNGFVQQWVEAYGPSGAKAYACPGLAEKKPQIHFSATVGETRSPPAEWQGDIELEWFNSEHNPFTRTPFFNEVVFLHKPSRTLFTADLFWSYPGNNIPSRTWLWKQGMDRVYLPFYKKFMVTRPELFRDSLDRVLAWDWDALLPCHGKFVPTGGKQALKEHYGLV